MSEETRYKAAVSIDTGAWVDAITAHVLDEVDARWSSKHECDCGCDSAHDVPPPSDPPAERMSEDDFAYWVENYAELTKGMNPDYLGALGELVAEARRARNAEAHWEGEAKRYCGNAEFWRTEWENQKYRIAELEAEVAKKTSSYLCEGTTADIQAGALKRAKTRIAELEREVKDALTSRDFYELRIAALQVEQKRMRDPERRIVCDLLANGTLMADPTGERYSVKPDHRIVEFERDLATARGLLFGCTPSGCHCDEDTGYVCNRCGEIRAFLAAKEGE